MNQTTAIEKYEDALANFFVHLYSHQHFDFALQTQFYEVGCEAEQYKNTTEYRDAVVHAERRAREQVEQRRRGG